MNRDGIVAGARDAIRQGSKSFRAASLLFDPATRERTWLLYCWCRHCDDLCDGQLSGFAGGRKGSVALLASRSREALAGRSNGELPFDALALLNKERPIPARLVDEHLRGFELDELGWRPQSEADLIRYCYHVAGAVGCMMAVQMGVDPEDGDVLDRAADLGIAFQLSNILRDLKEDRQAGRCYVPADWLDELGMTTATMFDPAHRSGLLAIVARLARLAREHEQRARSGVGALPFRSRLAVLSAARIYGAIGRRVEALGDIAWDRRVTIGRWRKIGFLLSSLVEAIAPAARR